LVHGSRCEAVAARLVAREGLALDHGDIVPVAGEPVASGRTGRSAADDEDLGVDVGGVAHETAVWPLPDGSGHTDR
jgi:hypothetical protein